MNDQKEIERVAFEKLVNEISCMTNPDAVFMGNRPIKFTDRIVAAWHLRKLEPYKRLVEAAKKIKDWSHCYCEIEDNGLRPNGKECPPCVAKEALKKVEG